MEILTKSSNRTFMELKYPDGSTYDSWSPSSNRTFMELKLKGVKIMAASKKF